MFDRGAEFTRPTGRAAIAGGSSNPEHHRAIEQGIAHFAGLPYVRITGDTAFAISYLQILVPDRVGPLFDVPNHGSSRGFHVHRVSANRWEFVRTHGGLEDKAPDLAPAGRHPVGARDIGRRAGGINRSVTHGPAVIRSVSTSTGAAVMLHRQSRPARLDIRLAHPRRDLCPGAPILLVGRVDAAPTLARFGPARAHARPKPGYSACICGTHC